MVNPLGRGILVDVIVGQNEPVYVARGAPYAVWLVLAVIVQAGRAEITWEKTRNVKNTIFFKIQSVTCRTSGDG